MTPGGDKNGADINLALDALEMAFTHQHINAYVIVGGDSDFLSLVEKLKQYDKKVFVVGGRAFTSMILQRNCHEFIAYENLARRAEERRQDRAADAGRGRELAGARRRCRSSGARSRSSRTAKSRRRPACSRARCCSSTRRSPSATTAPRRSSISSRSSSQAGPRQPQARRPQRDGGAERRRLGRGRRGGCASSGRRDAGPLAAPAYGEQRRGANGGAAARPVTDVAQMFRAAEDQAARVRRRRGPAAGAGSTVDVRQTEGAEAGVQRAGQILSTRDDGPLADVSAQRETDPAAGRRRVRRAPLRLRRPDGSAEGVSARGVRPDRARSPRRAARVPGRRDAESGSDAQRTDRDHGRRTDRNAAW